MWKTPTLASYEPGAVPSSTQESRWRSQLPGAQPLLAAFTSRVRPEQRPGAPDVLGGRSREELGRLPSETACRGGRAAARPRAGLPRSAMPCRASSGSGPIAAPHQDRRREVGARREDDHVGVDPLAGGGVRRRSRAPRPGRRGRPACRRGRRGSACLAPRRGTRTPCSSASRRRRSTEAAPRRPAATDRRGRRARRTRRLAPPRGRRRGAARARACWPGATRSISRARRR